MGYETITVERKEGIMTITLNRPEKLNAVNMKMLEELAEPLKQAERDLEVKVVLLKGAGRAFSAGWDLNEPHESKGSRDPEKYLRFQRENIEIYDRMVHTSVPIVAAVHGYALGQGFGLMASCDIVIATEDAKIGTPEVRFGMSSTGWPMPTALGRNRAMEFFLTGDMVSGRQAEALGIVNRAVPRDRFEKEVYKMVKKLSYIPRVTLEINKAAIRDFYREYDAHLMDYRALGGTIIETCEEYLRIHDQLVKDGSKKWVKKFRERFAEIEKI